MTKLTQLLMERYLDGELSETEAREVETLLESDPDAAAALARMETLSGLVHDANDPSLEGVDFAAMTQNVMSQIEEQQRSRLSERAKVWFQEFMEHRRAVWIPAAAMATAALALVLAFPFFSNPAVQHATPRRGNDRIWTASHTPTPATALCRVLTVLAGLGETPFMSPALEAYKGIFAKTPFARFNRFELIEMRPLTLTLGKPEALPGPLEGALTLTGAKDKTLAFSLALNGEAGTPRALSTPAAAPLFTLGPTSDRGTTIVGIDCSRPS